MPNSKMTHLDAAYSSADPDANKSLYRNWADTYDQGFAAKSDYQPAKLVARAYLDAGGGWPVLDVGCGTGLVAETFPESAVVDGLDYSPEMLAVADKKGIYRELIEADLNSPLTLTADAYAGFVSAGTFTIGHVGPDAIPKILELVRPGGTCVLSGNIVHYRKAGFDDVIGSLVAARRITVPELSQHKIYANVTGAPPGHSEDIGFLLVFCRL